MSDDVIVPGLDDPVAADEVAGGVKVQLFKLAYSADGSRTHATVDANGVLVTATTLPLPSGASTAARQDTGNTSLASIDGKITAVNTGAVVVSSSALPSGAATGAKQDTGNSSLASIDGKITAVNTGAVVVASSALPSGASTGAKQDTEIASLASIDGKITAVNTGAVVVSSSALPSGAATDAKQDTGNSSLASIDGKITAVNTGAVVVSSSALPSGASTLAEQQMQTSGLAAILVELGQKLEPGDLSSLSTAANQTTVIASLATIAAYLAGLSLAQGATGTSQVGPMVQGRVSDSPNSYLDGELRPASLTVDGRLRVTTASEVQNYTPWGSPWSWGDDDQTIDKYPLSAW